MQYMILIAASEADENAMSEEAMGQLMGAYGAYTEAMVQAGVLVSGERLQPVATATTVRVRDGKTSVLDGPYVEAREQLGGFYIIEAPDLDAALGWAARCPSAAYGSIEVRPVWKM